MPDLRRIAAELAAMRSGHGPRRPELRDALNGVDPDLRRQRNVERLRLADAMARLRTMDTLDPRALQAAVEASAQRLAVLDQRIVEAVAQIEACATEHVAPQAPSRANPMEIAEARAVLRA